ncbi:MAG: 2-oxoglutarate oxidoreductase [Elusimicrobia bacterium]|nr:2-oxoglutarate oxidoreductase [Elusimicrobiota bacterium]
MQLLNEKPKSLLDIQMHYCPGCGHGIIHRLVAEAMDELNIREKTIGVAPVGCAVFADHYFNCDMIQGPHGRGPAIATGIKRSVPESVVFSYQGDGDLASIGMGEIVHAAARGEKLTVIFVNNAIYGMTGGQMAPTTLIGQKSTTTVDGRKPEINGFPIRMCEMLSTLDGVVYAERTTVHNVAGVVKSKNAIKKAFQNQIENKGFSIVEILSMCPTNWGTRLDNPSEATKYISDSMVKVFPPGVYKDISAK